MSFKSFINVNVLQDIEPGSDPGQGTTPPDNTDQPGSGNEGTTDNPTGQESGSGNEKDNKNTGQDPAKENKKTDILPTDQESDSSPVATVPDTGHVTYDLEPMVGGGLFLAGISFLIFIAILTKKIITKKKHNSSVIKPIHKKQTNNFASIFGILVFPALTVAGLLAAFISFSSFAATSELELPVKAGRWVDVDVSGNGEFYMMSDTIRIPASSTGYEVYLKASSQYLVSEEGTGRIESIAESGELGPNSFGYLADYQGPITEATEFSPLPANGDVVEIYTSESGEAAEIPIHFAVRLTNLKRGRYSVAIEYIVKTNRELIMQNSTAEVCNLLTPGISYTFIDSRDNKSYTVEKLKDGNCWMTESLKLDLRQFDENNPLTSADTDINVNWVTGVRVGEEDDPDPQYELIGSDDYGVPSMETQEFDYYPNPEFQDTYEETMLYRYNWYTMTARSGASAYANATSYHYSSFDAQYSICPKGWHLPNDSELERVADLETYEKLLSLYHKELTGNSQWAASRYDVFGSSTILSSEEVLTLGIFEDSNYTRFSSVGNSINDTFMVSCMIGGSADTMALKYNYNTEASDRIENFPGDEVVGRDSDGNFTFQISTKTPTRQGYEFMGWAIEPNGREKYSPGDSESIRASELELYAVWRRSTGTTLQSFTSDMCFNLETDETYAIEDARDHKKYTIAKLRDGNCWMTQNLALGGEEAILLTPDDTDIENDFTLPAVSTGDEWLRYDEEGDNVAKTFIGGNGYTDSGGERRNDETDGEYYYNKYAAYAIADDGEMFDREELESSDPESAPNTSICPKGWRLPEVHNFDEGNYREIRNLLKSYAQEDPEGDYWLYASAATSDPLNLSFSGLFEWGVMSDGFQLSLWTRDLNNAEYFMPDYWRGYTSRNYSVYDMRISTELTTESLGSPVRCVFAAEDTYLYFDKNTDDEVVDLPGRISGTSDADTYGFYMVFDIPDETPKRDGAVFAGWAFSEDEENAEKLYHEGETMRIYGRSISNVLYAVWREELAVGGKTITLQTLTPEICENAMETDKTYGLRDSRDNKIYTVAKLRDGNCWMTQDLALGGDRAMLLTPEDTNITKNFTLPALSVRPDADDYESYEEYEEAWSEYEADWDTSYYNQTHPRVGVGFYGGGNIYNWTAAVAKSDSSAYLSTVDSSICPKGWRLPRMRTNQESEYLEWMGNEFSSMNSAYSFYDEFSGSEWYLPLTASPLLFSNGVTRDEDGVTYWSPTAGGDYVAFYYSAEYGNFSPYDIRESERNRGKSIRCLLDLPEPETQESEPEPESDFEPESVSLSSPLLMTSTPSVYNNPSAQNYSYGSYGSYDSELGDGEPEESEEEPESAPTSTGGKTDPLGVVSGQEEESTDLSTVIVIAVSSLLVIAGISAVVIMERQKRKDL